MAHFAELDKNNQVLRVVVVVNEVLENKELPDSEILGTSFLRQLYGTDTNWKQTSYNEKFRGSFAGIGYTYYPDKDCFLPPQPFPSWIISNNKWIPPVPKPDNKKYNWNEKTKSWDYIPPRKQPFPSWTLDENDDWQPPIPKPTDLLPEGSNYIWAEGQKKWVILPPGPTVPPPEGKRYVYNLKTNEWFLQDKPLGATGFTGSTGV